MSQQGNTIQYLQGTTSGGATANGNGTPVDTSGVDSALMVELRETAGGTCTVTFQGSFDGTNWYALGYYQVDNQASLTRSVSAVSVTANMAHVYQILDPYPQTRAVVASVAAGATVTVRAYCI